MKRIRSYDYVGKLLRHKSSRRRRLGWLSSGGGRRSRARGGSLSAKDFKHNSATGRAFAFDGFSPVFHRFFHRIYDFLLGLAFDAVSFGHKKLAATTLHAPRQLREIAWGRPEEASIRKERGDSAFPITIISYYGRITYSSNLGGSNSSLPFTDRILRKEEP